MAGYPGEALKETMQTPSDQAAPEIAREVRDDRNSRDGRLSRDGRAAGDCRVAGEGLDRAEILRRFERWLDDVLAAEEAPAGIDAELLAAVEGLSHVEPGGASATAGREARAAGGPLEWSHGGSERETDAYALWSAATALTQEIKLQSRAFKDLSGILASQPDRIAQEIEAAFRERERELQREAERRCDGRAIAGLIDLRDRLDRGLESVRAGSGEPGRAGRPSEPGRSGEPGRAGESGGSGEARWLARVWHRWRRGDRDDAAARTLAALTTGYELALARLDDMLNELNVHEIRCEDQPFDPKRMNAIDRQETTAVPEGTVLEVYRRGYEWRGEVFRPAQVKVAFREERREERA